MCKRCSQFMDFGIREVELPRFFKSIGEKGSTSSAFVSPCDTNVVLVSTRGEDHYKDFITDVRNPILPVVYECAVSGLGFAQVSRRKMKRYRAITLSEFVCVGKRNSNITDNKPYYTTIYSASTVFDIVAELFPSYAAECAVLSAQLFPRYKNIYPDIWEGVYNLAFDLDDSTIPILLDVFKIGRQD